MAANYSTNPTNPVNQQGGQMLPGDMQGQQGMVPPPSGMQNPKSIRDYVAAARAAKATPTFTNVPETQGFFIDDRQQAGAIPEGPQSEYEATPFAERIKQDPWKRATARVQTMLPELWEATFPGYQQGATLSNDQMKQWNEVVQNLTVNLIKHYDKQYEWAIKNEAKGAETKEKDRKFWQSKFVDAQLRGQPVRKEDGSPMSEAEFVNQRMSAAEEMRFKEDVTKDERISQQATENLTPGTVAKAMKKNPNLARAIRLQIKTFVQDGIGRELTDDEYRELMKNPDAQDLINEASKDAVDYYSDKIMEEISGKKGAIDPMTDPNN